MADGTRINGRYRLVEPLGSGSGGRVFRVLDGDAGDAPRALKCVHASVGDAPRLIGEFRRLAAIRHPNLVRVYDLERVRAGCRDVPAGSLFFTSELIEGEALAPGHVDREPARLLAIAGDIGSALATLHAGGLVHCDVKPDNILVEAGGRAVLVDLGLSGGLGEVGARGTPLYMAPEALAGRPEPASDVLGLALALRYAATGAAPRSGDRLRVIEQIRSGAVASIDDAGWIPAELRALLDRWCDRDPSARPSSAVIALRDLARAAEAVGLAPPDTPALPGPPPFVGRDRELGELVRFLREADGERPRQRLVELCGPAGVGKRTTLSVAVRRVQIDAALGGRPGVRLLRGDVPTLARALDVDATPSALADAIAGASGGELRAVVIEEDSPQAVQLFAALREREVPVVAIRVAEVATGWGQRVTLRTLGRESIAALARGMIDAPLSQDWLTELWRASTGLPGVAADIVRAAAATGKAIASTRPAALVGSDHAALLVARAVSRPPDEIAVLEVLAIFGGAANVEEIAEVAEASEESVFEAAGRAATAGLCSIADGRVALASAAQGEAVRAAIPEARSRALHRAVLRLRERQGQTSPLVLWPHEAAAGSAAQAARVCMDAALELSRLGRSDAATRAARAACSRATGAAASRAAAVLAETACASGDYAEAEEAAERATRAKSEEVRHRGRLLLARAAMKRGALERARVALQPLAGQDAEACALLSRVEVAAGRLDRARELASTVGDAAPVAARALALEAAALAQVYAGDTEDAEESLDALESLARATEDRALRARSLALRGICDQAAGRTARAADRYAVAAEAVRETGNLHAAAIYDVNCATAESHRGRHGSALRALDRALLALESTASPEELAGAWFNRGIALLAVGELESAGRAASRALECSTERSKMHHYARLLAGDVARRQGDLDHASDCYERVAAADLAAETPDLMFEARLNLAELAALRGDPGPLLAIDGALAPSDDARARLLLARGRAAIAHGLAEPHPESLAQLARERAASGRDDLAWRSAVIAARLHRGLGNRQAAADLAAVAREIFDALAADTPEELRPGLRRDPDRQALAALQEDLSVSGSQTPATEESTLRRLVALARRLNSELRLQPLLDDVIDTVIELSGAERGFLLLRSPGGELEVVVARNFDRAALEAGSRELSRSIAERAAISGELVVTLDAGEDERWTGAESVAAMHLRSVLAAPLRDKSKLVGTVYLDHRYRTAAFDNRTAHLVREVADLAAVAISNARLAEENRAKQREILDLNARLEEDLQRAQGELIEVRNRVPDAIAIGFDAIVGRSPVMLELFEAIERAAAAEVPVVVCGPSGSGKELVARAIHKRCARRGAPFVALNCGAVPATLMESELFGHARGAFTGAHRDKRGLFEIAHGGILFLDEIADTDPAMQAKLLRVLQEGELRRVGDTEVRTVDVRIVCATQRPLAELVEAGKFREDLYYRLHVLEIVVPSLRQRREDIPELAEHILRRIGGDSAPRIAPDALARLVAYDWPGNVRELENELARAQAMSAGGTITAAEISVDAPSPTSPGDSVRSLSSLEVRPRLEALERALVEEALRRCSGNQSQAARMLGLSRFGLQKKLKRYGMTVPA